MATLKAPTIKMPAAPKAKMPTVGKTSSKLPAVPKAPNLTGGMKAYAAASKLTMPKLPKVGTKFTP